MSSHTISEAFQRLPRPQAPTKAALLEKSRRRFKDEKLIEERKSHDRRMTTPSSKVTLQNPWHNFCRLGELVQANHTWLLCDHNGSLALMKRSNPKNGRQEMEKMSRLREHPNISSIKQAFEFEGSMYFHFNFTRHTLEEVLNVHTNLEERHIRLIASAMFHALKHMASQGVVHNAISVATIRFCGDSGKPVLSNFENATWVTPHATPNTDLEHLGSALLECMSGLPTTALRDPSFIRSQRAENKMFGLIEGEKWSGHKLLIDFLDHLLSQSVLPSTKFERQHQYVLQNPVYGNLKSFLALVSLECFALWQPAAAVRHHSLRQIE